VPPPPPKPPGRPGLTASASQPPAGEDAIAKSKREKDELVDEVKGVEEELEALKARYEQYFLGIERREPNRWRDEVRKKVLRLKTAFTRNTGLRFKIQSLHARYLSYERLWLRGAREREEGTYRRDLFKARLHARGREEAAEEAPAKAAAAPPAGPAVAGAAQSPPAAAMEKQPGPAPAPRLATPAVKPAPAAAPDRQMRELYDAYIAAKKRCNEDVSRITYEAVAKSVSKQIPELISKYKAKSVDFRVEVKDGKAILKAIPKV
jgi:hypothetical protein